MPDAKQGINKFLNGGSIPGPELCLVDVHVQCYLVREVHAAIAPVHKLDQFHQSIAAQMLAYFLNDMVSIRQKLHMCGIPII